jgi:hypothetical protein
MNRQAARGREERSVEMSTLKLIQQMIGLTLVLLLLSGCGTPAATPAPLMITTPTPVPPTATPTPMPPTAPPASTPPTTTPTPSPEVLTLLAWIDAFNQRDIDTFMSYVADTAVLDRGPHGIVTGAEAIREIMLLEFKDPITARVTWWSVDGNTITYGSYVQVGGQRIDSCTSLMVIENGKIVSDLCAP